MFTVSLHAALNLYVHEPTVDSAILTESSTTYFISLKCQIVSCHFVYNFKTERNHRSSYAQNNRTRNICAYILFVINISNLFSIAGDSWLESTK